LRRLRGEALLVRQIARTFQSARWATNEPLLDRSACLSWRIARVISGRLRGHPYAQYQSDASLAIRATNRILAGCLNFANKNRADGLKVVTKHVTALGRQLDDAIALAWSSEFSEALTRAQSDLRSLGTALLDETQSGGVQERPVIRAAFSNERVGDIGAALDGDWPYLAF
jgi:hypothetical protein